LDCLVDLFLPRLGELIRNLRMRCDCWQGESLERFAARVGGATDSYCLKPNTFDAALHPTVYGADMHALAIRSQWQEFGNLSQSDQRFAFDLDHKILPDVFADRTVCHPGEIQSAVLC
jgi:hypothetical protein